MIAWPFLRRAVLAAALVAVVVPAAAPLAGPAGWAAPVWAVEPAEGETAAVDPAPVDPEPTVTRHGPRSERVVALTFDDGWNPGTLRQIYRILVRERVPATFFVTGIYVQRAPALWRQIAAAGFPLANHSYLHRDTRELAPSAVATDLALTREVVEKATGRAMLPYYRPPYGARTTETDRLAAAAGFPVIVLWDTTGGDTGPNPTVRSVVRDATAGRPGSIVLLHAGPRVTPHALPAIIARYRARGFEFVTLPELLGAPSVGSPPVPDPSPRPGPSTAGQAPAAGPSRSVDRRGEDARPVPTGDPAPTMTAGGHAVAAGERGNEAPPARPAPRADPSPPARDAAWARRVGTDSSVALFTVGILVILLAIAVVAGRARRPGDDAVA